MPTRAVSVALFLLVFLNGAYVVQRRAPNQESRLSLLYSMVTEYGVNIDSRAKINMDSAQFNGHTYSDKAPSTAFLALPAFAVAHIAADAFHLGALSRYGTDIRLWVATAGSSALLAALGTVALWLLLARICDRRTAAAAAAGLALGTLQLPYSTQLFSHAATMGLLSVALLLMLSPRAAPRKREGMAGAWKQNAIPMTLLLAGTAAALVSSGGAWFTIGVGIAMTGALALLCMAVVRMNDDRCANIDRDLVAGLACGLACTGEYTAIVAAAGLLAVALRDKPSRAGLFLLGAACPLLLCGGYNMLAFGSPLSIGYQHNGYAWMQQGVLGLGLSFNTDALGALLLSQGRGLFFWSPFLLLALPGYRTLWLQQRRLFWLCSVVPVATLLLLCCMGSPYGGEAVGARYLAPAIPLLVLAAAFGLRTLPRSGRVLIGLSIAMNLMATVVSPIMPELLASPFINYYLAKTLAGNFMQNLGAALGLAGGWSVLPIVIVDTAASIWLLFCCWDSVKTPRKRSPHATPKPRAQHPRRRAPVTSA